MFALNTHCSLAAFAALANGRLRRLAVRRILEDAGYSRDCSWRWRRGHAPPRREANRTQVEPATYAGVIVPETGQFLLLCSLQLWQQLQRCRQTRARVPLFLVHFTSVLRKQFAANDMFLRETNTYKRALALRNSRQTISRASCLLVTKTLPRGWAPTDYIESSQD